ncbi:MAG: hypothetical protein U5L96_14145 [Owenweeksia sp.]|nr:hypothetical protein [Owenweeksia sp.]
MNRLSLILLAAFPVMLFSQNTGNDKPDKTRKYSNEFLNIGVDVTGTLGMSGLGHMLLRRMTPRLDTGTRPGWPRCDQAPGSAAAMHQRVACRHPLSLIYLS